MTKPAINVLTRDNVNEFTKVSNYQNKTGMNVLDLYQRFATRSAIYPGQGGPLGLAYVALKMNGEAGEFAEHVGKAMRDDYLMQDGEPTPERRTLLIKEIGDVLWYLSAACNELKITLSDAALQNLEKLCDRSERNALRGSGDER